MKKNLTELVFILDRSGSMQGLELATPIFGLIPPKHIQIAGD